MERLCAALALAALMFGVSVSAHAGPVQLSLIDDGAPQSAAHAPLFALDDDAIVTLAICDDDAPNRVFAWFRGEDETRRTEGESIAWMGLLGLRHCLWHDGDAVCGPDCARSAFERTQRIGFASENAHPSTRVLQVALPDSVSHEIINWGDQGWETGTGIQSEPDLGFSLNAPTVPLPRSFILGAAGLAMLIVIRWRSFSR